VLGGKVKGKSNDVRAAKVALRCNRNGAVLRFNEKSIPCYRGVEGSKAATLGIV